jgi:molybdate transport system substrate-binding protein
MRPLHSCFFSEFAPCRGRLLSRPSSDCGLSRAKTRGGSTPLSRNPLGAPGSLFEPGSFFFSSLAGFFRILCALCVSVAIPLLSSAQQPQLNIAVASDLKFAMTELASAYEKQSGVKVHLTFGSSGNFFAQIQNGAPFDIFFSADSNYPHKLSEAGLVIPNSTYDYAIGRLVLWARPDAETDPAKSGWNTLLDPAVQRIAIANPDHAPYGRAAVAALRSSGLYDKVKDKLVFGENIAQASQFVQSGGAQVGFLSMSLALSPPLRSGKYWEIPRHQYFPLIQSAVVLKRTEQKDLAASFMQFVASPAGTKTLQDFGFEKPQTSFDRSPQRTKPY